jgi:hypothetical protein
VRGGAAGTGNLAPRRVPIACHRGPCDGTSLTAFDCKPRAFRAHASPVAGATARAPKAASLALAGAGLPGRRVKVLARARVEQMPSIGAAGTIARPARVPVSKPPMCAGTSRLTQHRIRGMGLRESIARGAGATGLVLSLLVAPAAWAHDDAYLDTLTAPHGGQLRMVGSQHYELVVVKDSKTARDNAIAVYVTDHAGAKISTVGATGAVSLVAGKSTVRAELRPAGDNKLEGHAFYASTPGLKALVSITLAGLPAQQARFTPLAKAAAGAHGAAVHQHPGAEHAPDPPAR